MKIYTFTHEGKEYFFAHVEDRIIWCNEVDTDCGDLEDHVGGATDMIEKKPKRKYNKRKIKTEAEGNAVTEAGPTATKTAQKRGPKPDEDVVNRNWNIINDLQEGKLSSSQIAEKHETAVEIVYGIKSKALKSGDLKLQSNTERKKEAVDVRIQHMLKNKLSFDDIKVAFPLMAVKELEERIAYADRENMG